ncbi:MAG: hypothetical protein E6235_05625 [Anaerococcus vaginalis]|uniref:hypothetical protein n=1 Tax=Anaerococcus TaxID=165779 RepID=UPI0008A12DE3|nr:MULTISPECIES: hypothetical protein [Anaerococcus]MDU5086514.1 hypothetical protein [Anaerococcus vaginalis]MDU5342094.1 hypothetical protein [Anaerococcus vaginalis]MDU5824491.1 hypothetical protein [Anaerococcus vaginalis]OFL18713.1 hypothetical protein HMPREF2782_02500 [Anaerococcus sp. HMSC068A02]
MIEIFVSKLCPDCTEIIEDYNNDSKNFQGCEIIDITDSMINLKRFLAYRDNFNAFEEKIKTNQVGIPVKIIDKKEVEFL